MRLDPLPQGSQSGLRIQDFSGFFPQSGECPRIDDVNEEVTGPKKTPKAATCVAFGDFRSRAAEDPRRTSQERNGRVVEFCPGFGYNSLGGARCLRTLP